jgi:hypothetical protein
VKTVKHNFYEKLAYSRGAREQSDLALLQSIIPWCVKVEKTGVEEDKAGVDYIATLKHGATIRIDAKTREKGCSRHWRHGEPELALKKQSVIVNGHMEKIGWTLDAGKNVDEILYTFDPRDSGMVYRLPFHILRSAFHKCGGDWQKAYGLKYQDSGNWKSSAIFVPASIIMQAVNAEMGFAGGLRLAGSGVAK